jgi:hypothetical protein
VKICKHCGLEIVPTQYGTWGDADNPGYEVCDLADDYGPSHEPETDVEYDDHAGCNAAHDNGRCVP